MEAAHAIRERIENGGHLVVLTGAGISAESGIPTFRGKEGFWTVGSREYRPEEMATSGMFRKKPKEVWQWYLYRLKLCRNAQPNRAHIAVANLEKHLRDRFLLITQNVDGLHLRAGSSEQRTYQIHGNIEYVRCTGTCGATIMPIPDGVTPKERDEPLTEADEAGLVCSECNLWYRPHVLWFDESYNERHYHFDSSIKAAVSASVLITIGTSGATNLPMQVGAVAAQKGALLVDINPDENPFSEMAVDNGGYALQGKAGEILPDFIEQIIE